MSPVAVLVTEQDTRATELGPALWVTIERADGRRMCWTEVHGVYVEHYPGRWAVQVFPPSDRTLNGAHRYHLWVLDHEPQGMDVGAPASLRRLRAVGEALDHLDAEDVVRERREEDP